MSALTEDEHGNWNIVYYTDIAGSLPADDHTSNPLTIAS